MFYIIEETLIPVSQKEATESGKPYVGILSMAQWVMNRTEEQIVETRIDVNIGSYTGTFCLPHSADMKKSPAVFAFEITENSALFADDGDYVQNICTEIAATKKWRTPCVERFLYDFLELITKEDRKNLQEYEKKLNAIEKSVSEQNTAPSYVTAVNEIRGELLDLKSSYEQLIDLGQELEENDNELFNEENLKYFHFFSTRAERLYNAVASLQEYTIQIRDLYQTQLDVRMNRILAVLTVLTTIFFPLTIITGWYGMNFVHMPELQYTWSYPAVIVVCALIVSGQIIWFGRRKFW